MYQHTLEGGMGGLGKKCRKYTLWEIEKLRRKEKFLVHTEVQRQNRVGFIEEGTIEKFLWGFKRRCRGEKWTPSGAHKRGKSRCYYGFGWSMVGKKTDWVPKKIPNSTKKGQRKRSNGRGELRDK